MDCLSCASDNVDSSRVCIKCGEPLNSSRAQQLLDRADEEIKKGRFEYASLHLAKADGEMLSIPWGSPQRQPLSARAFWLQGMIYYHHGQTVEARAELEHAAQVLQACPDQQQLHANVLITLGNIDYLKNQFGTARQHYEQGSELAIQAAAHAVAARALNNLSLIYMNDGEQEQARALLRRGLEQAELSGDAGAVANAYRLLSASYQNTGPYSLALDYINRAVAMREQVDNQLMVVQVIIQAAAVHLNYGNLDLAEQLLREAYDLSRKVDNKIEQWDTINNLTILSRLRGDDEKWSNYALRTFNNPNGVILWRSHAAYELVLYYLNHNDVEHARSHVHWLKTNAGPGQEVSVDNGYYNRAAAALQAAEGNWPVSDHFFHAAMAALTHEQNYFELAQTLEEYAAMLRRWAESEPTSGAGSRARAVLQQAADLYRRLEIPTHLALVETMLQVG